MTRTADDDHGYGGDAAAYDGSTSWCARCDAPIVWPDTTLAHADRHVAARVMESERADAEQAELARELRRERDMRRGGRPE